MKRISGRQYEFVNCKGVTLIFHDEWTSSDLNCSISREKNGKEISVFVDSAKSMMLSDLNKQVLTAQRSKSPWVHWSTVKNARIYLRASSNGVEFIKWREEFAIFGHAVSPNYNMYSPSATDTVVNWHISNIRRT